MGSRCTGACCREFFLPPLDQLAAEALWFAVLGDIADAAERIAIVAMVVPVRLCRPGNPMPSGRINEEGEEMVYTCRHFDGANCTIYERRPHMCRNFPYGRPCPYGDACTWDEGREGARIRLPVVNDGSEVEPGPQSALEVA